MFELWVAIPIGIGFEAIEGCFNGLEQKLILRGHKQKAEKETTIKKIWNKYGVIGLGLLSPLLTGAPLGVALGLMLNAEKKKLMIFVILGIFIWSTVLTLIGVYSFDTFKYFIKH